MIKSINFEVFMQQSPNVTGISAASHPVPTSQTTPILGRIDQLFTDFKQASDKQVQIDKLHEAYSLCLTQIQSNDPIIMGRISMILGEFGILLYGQEPKYPGKSFPAGAEFTISKQVLLGALQAFLVRIKANQVVINFNAPGNQDLKRLPETILDQKPFASVEDLFIRADRNVLIDLARSANLSDLERVHFSRLLRYLNGAARHIRGVFEKREANEQDKKLIYNSLYVAREFARCDENEFFGVLYNDWEDVLRAEGRWDDKNKQELVDLLKKNAQNIGQEALATQKFFGPRKALDLCLGLFQRKMDAKDYQDLLAITQGKLLDPAQIDLIVKKLFALDLTGKDALSLPWFVIVPNNLAYKLMEANSDDVLQMKGLMALAKAIVEKRRKEGDYSFNFQAIDRNCARLQLYQQQPIREASARLQLVKGMLTDPKGSREEILFTLQQAKAAASLAKQAFEQYRSPVDDPLLKQIIKSQLDVTNELLTKIEEATVKLHQP